MTGSLHGCRVANNRKTTSWQLGRSGPKPMQVARLLAGWEPCSCADETRLILHEGENVEQEQEELRDINVQGNYGFDPVVGAVAGHDHGGVEEKVSGHEESCGMADAKRREWKRAWMSVAARQGRGERYGCVRQRRKENVPCG